MSKQIPYMSAPGSLPKILNKLISASTPEIFNADFLSTKLGFKGGNYRTFISWAKKCNLLNEDGSTGDLYKKFRNPSTSKRSMAEALKIGYGELYTRNEYCHEMNKKEFKSLVMEATGESHDSRKVDMMVSTFFKAKEFADFEDGTVDAEILTNGTLENTETTSQSNLSSSQKPIKLGLNYTINLVLPKTDDPAVFKAIFKTLKENLLNE